jgi:hypothetical protein
MVDTAAFLVDKVIPDEARVRQWVLSLPYRVRFVCAHDPAALAAVRRILVRAIADYYERAAARLGKPRPRAGAVAFVQRFDSALRLNVHFHVLWLDGVYSHQLGRIGVEWCEHEQVTDADVALLVRRVRDRVRLPRCVRWGSGQRMRTQAMRMWRVAGMLASSCCWSWMLRRCRAWRCLENALASVMFGWAVAAAMSRS